MGMKVFLVDDHELVRCGVADALRRAGHEVVGEAATLADARGRSGVLEFDAAVVDMPKVISLTYASPDTWGELPMLDGPQEQIPAAGPGQQLAMALSD